MNKTREERKLESELAELRRTVGEAYLGLRAQERILVTIRAIARVI